MDIISNPWGAGATPETIPRGVAGGSGKPPKSGLLIIRQIGVILRGGYGPAQLKCANSPPGPPSPPSPHPPGMVSGFPPLPQDPGKKTICNYVHSMSKKCIKKMYVKNKDRSRIKTERYSKSNKRKC